MSKYNQVLLEFIKGTALKRVRLKTDPRMESGFEHREPYEGFVLEEDNMGNVVVYIPKLGNEVEVPAGQYEPCDNGDPTENPHLDNLKRHIISDMIENGNLEGDDPNIENIMSINCIYQLHDYLDQKGVDDNQFLDILKSYFSNDEF